MVSICLLSPTQGGTRTFPKVVQSVSQIMKSLVAVNVLALWILPFWIIPWLLKMLS